MATDVTCLRQGLFVIAFSDWNQHCYFVDSSGFTSRGMMQLQTSARSSIKTLAVKISRRHETSTSDIDMVEFKGQSLVPVARCHLFPRSKILRSSSQI